jgi:hypothetical protein
MSMVLLIQDLLHDYIVVIFAIHFGSFRLQFGLNKFWTIDKLSSEIVD